MPVGTSLVLRDFTTSDVGNSSYITVTVTYIINGAQYNASATFYVDEWGEVS